eukprot:2103002-Pleurochrysis_carterae.AAC.1
MCGGRRPSARELADIEEADKRAAAAVFIDPVWSPEQALKELDARVVQRKKKYLGGGILQRNLRRERLALKAAMTLARDEASDDYKRARRSLAK